MSAFRVKPAVDYLERERIEIERRRQREADRIDRILHAKTRLYGVDTLALDQQVKEKQERERLEAERNFYHDDVAVLHARAISEQEAQRQMDVRKAAEEVNFFRKLQEQEKRRKQMIDESAATNLYDSDTLFLKFQGEDPKHAARVKAQQQQQQDWLAAQIHDLSSSEGRARQEDADYDAYQNDVLELKKNQEEEAARVRRRMQEETVEFNKQLSQQQMAQRARQAQMDQSLNDMELSNQMNSNFLNEGAKNGGAFKGFSSSQRQRILDEQHQQMQEAADVRQRQLAEARAYDQQQEDIRRAMVRADRQQQAYKTQALKNLQLERTMQAKEKTMRYDYLDNVVYTGSVTEEFFDKFGKSCR